ncbi:capsular biosynthesis protein [Mucilaginibacter sp. HMF5004]|uniref:tyrosine-protein phosphatase n=1 Tax=Mucilaginibacter rivuli TaxID=2857527 RepID=UPI001C6033DA|nr:CpsB/CapC family capsule biosynthesis tyrosine phosphatase [Mucilaginibacter rivuli]MBW4890911.1 capsular biosynthesis protein [Mucilaginibacter rivuli]
MFGIFKKKEKASTNFNFDVIGVDMHSHVLPGIDDGAQDVGQSIQLIRAMMDLGIKRIFATPHIMADYYRNTPETIGAALEILRAELVKENIDIKVDAAAEYYCDEAFVTKLENEKLLTFGEEKYLLFEFSFMSMPPDFMETLHKMRRAGYQPILAHPERYGYFTVEKCTELKDWGCLMQVNTTSLTGYHGKEVKKFAEQLVDELLVDFISSDMHHLKHAESLRESLKLPYVQRLLSEYPLLQNKGLL